MAIDSSKKKKKKLKRASVFQNSSSFMASSSTVSSCFIRNRRITILSVSLIVSVIVIFYISSIAIKKMKFEEVISSQISSIEVVNEFPHDPNAFTQGLLYGGNDTFFESTGVYGRSSVRKVALHTGKVEVLQKMDDSYFGEGLTLLGERLFQVTWLKKIGFVYDRYNLSKFEEFTHEMRDGWGLATDGEVLFGSDGSSTLYKLSPHTFKVIEKATVKYKDFEVHNLNELEYINGEVWANVWSSDCIARISPKDGIVLGWILLPNLRNHLFQAGNVGIDVLNGIAWDSEKNRIFVTGKLWPKLYEIKLHPIREPFHGSIERHCLRRRAFGFAEP
ncbi:Glutaminyl-peptide cyclotransferase [Thalictrum thalictroides]|uniref:Glutaminyl-peptide cyclotransferase n=1 Tax=Thalictrum thalictroides TaxID=46969 RepID=A0A7J6W674_THATH|nr:Glutaminyl-peptide cyclotransferase [Thalictrum thalictroides]